EVLPLLGPLVDAHVLDGEGAHVKVARGEVALPLALDVAALLALDVVVLNLFGRLLLAMQGDEPLAGEVNAVLPVVDADPAAAEAFRSFGRSAGTEEAVQHE